MKFMNLIFMLISINLISYKVSAMGLVDMGEIFVFFTDIMERITEGIGEANTGETLFGDKTSSILIDKVDELSVQIEAMETRLMDKMQEIADAVKAVPDQVEKDRLLTKISQHIKSVKESYREVKKLGSKTITEKKAIRIIERYVHEKITDDLKEIMFTVLPDAETHEYIDKSFLKLIVKLESDEKETKERCDKKNSPQQLLYQFYLTLVSTEMIGYTSLAYGFAVNELIYPEEKADLEIQTVMEDILNRIYRYNLGFSKAIAQVPRYFRTCDNPGKHERDVTFTEFTGLYQKVVFAEYNLKRHDSCGGECEVPVKNENTYCYARPQSHTWSETEEVRSTPWDSDGRPKDVWSCTTNLNCAGTLSGCFKVNSIKYCMDKNYTSRRYDYVEDASNGIRWGQWVSSCEIYDQWSEKNDKYGNVCNYCMCTCDNDTWEARLTVNAVSLLPSRSNTSNNMVITGMRIKVHQKIVHIQVKEGKIIDNFHIETPKIKRNKETKKLRRVQKWVDLPDIEEDVRDARRYRSPQKLREDVDFVAWHWNDNAFNLDEVSIPSGRVLTGVRFAMVEIKEGEKKKRIQVQAESMEYDHVIGKLIQGTEEWTKPDPDNHDVKLEFVNDLPIKTDQPTILDSETNQYVVPGISDVWKDAGQSVLPFMDAQTIGCKPETPLGGIGLHHRGVAKDSEDSGFLGLSAHTVDYASFLKEGAKKYAETRNLQGKEDKKYDEDEYEYDDDD